MDSRTLPEIPPQFIIPFIIPCSDNSRFWHCVIRLDCNKRRIRPSKTVKYRTPTVVLFDYVVLLVLISLSSFSSASARPFCDASSSLCDFAKSGNGTAGPDSDVPAALAGAGAGTGADAVGTDGAGAALAVGVCFGAEKDTNATDRVGIATVGDI